ncbi:MAG: sugar ABC transporter permease [Actinomycetota bacterium]|nr:sugar ABC transporter permease [Actinomycetota bacterium]
MAASSQQTSGKKGGPLRGLGREFTDPERRTAYYMVLPTIIVILAIAFYPVAASIYYSLRLDVPGGEGGTWVGLRNYIVMFQDSGFRAAIFNTTIFVLISVAIEFVLGLAVALAINRAFRGRGAVRAGILVPWAFPLIVSAVMWRLMYLPSGGVLNYLAVVWGPLNTPILTDSTLLLAGAILSDVWKTTPFMALLLLAGLQTIPGDVYEAAKVDGASRMQSFFRITLPLLKGSILVALLFRTLDAWRIFDLFWGMSDRQLESLSTYAYKTVRLSQVLFNVGNAAAVFTFITAIIIAMIFIKGFGMQTSPGGGK